MHCLFKFAWVKLLRSRLPSGKGIMGSWAKLASHVAFRKGQATYCGYQNEVEPGIWVGGIVGLKKILGAKSRAQAIAIMDELSRLGYIEYTIEEKTKKLTYRICDWVMECSGKACASGTVYAVEEYGFLCVSRLITQRLVEQNYIFEEADAWLDLWCHTVWEDPRNAFSFLAASLQYSNGAVLTLETLGKRWGWEKTKVWRFFKKNGDVFALHRLPGNYGCLIFNKSYPTGTDRSMPTSGEIDVVFKAQKRQIVEQEVSLEKRIALSDAIKRAYLSLGCWYYEGYCYKGYCYYDCKDNKYPSNTEVATTIRGP